LENILKLSIPPDVGGRFSVLTSAGLLSALAAGIDIKKVFSGASSAKERLLKLPLQENPAALIAVNHLLFYEKRKTISVLFSYSNSLYSFADWYRQLWAESLGKKYSRSGEKLEIGPTPIKALGATDQHSQVQLYIEGKNDKVITFLKVENFRNEIPIPHLYKDIEALEYLGGKSLKQLLNSELEGTAYALKKNNRPNITVTFPCINEENIGEFIFTYELATVLFAYLANINPFDQPGVEEGKKAAYALLGRKGYEKIAEEIRK